MKRKILVNIKDIQLKAAADKDFRIQLLNEEFYNDLMESLTTPSEEEMEKSWMKRVQMKQERDNIRFWLPKMRASAARQLARENS